MPRFGPARGNLGPVPDGPGGLEVDIESLPRFEEVAFRYVQICSIAIRQNLSRI